MKYAEAISELQQRSLDALKVARSSQIASLETTREFAQTLSAQRPSGFLAPTVIRAMTNLTTGFAFALLEQQVAYAKHLADALVKPPAAPLATSAQLAVTPAPQAMPDSTPAATDGAIAPADACTLAADDAVTVAVDDAVPLAADDAITLPADDEVSLAPNGAITLPADDAVSFATNGAITLSADDAVTLTADDAVSLAAHDAVSLAADGAVSLVPDDPASLTADDATSTALADVGLQGGEGSAAPLGESAVPAIAEPQAAEGASIESPGPATPPQLHTEHVFSKTFDVPEAPSESSAFPASSGNAARKPPKLKTVSNNRPKPKRNPGK